jgi:hypothetical protein
VRALSQTGLARQKRFQSRGKGPGIFYGRHMASTFDPLQRNVRNIMGEKMCRHAADIVEAPCHYQSWHLQCAQHGRHAKQRFPFGKNLCESVAQADRRRGADQARHIVAAAPVALGIALEEFAAQHVADEFVNGRRARDPSFFLSRIYHCQIVGTGASARLVVAASKRSENRIPGRCDIDPTDWDVR